jgi:hypothetical protein
MLAGALGASVPLHGASKKLLGASKKENVLRFATDRYDIVIAVEFYDRYASQGFWFDERATQDHFCLSDAGDRNRDCLKGFVGSLAVVKYRIRPLTGDVDHTALREHVRTIDQDDTLPERVPTDRAIELVRGLGSDIQAFGIRTESPASVSLPESSGPWSFVRQDLYLDENTSPFLIVHWKHELNAIRMLDAIPCAGTSASTGK